MASKIEVAARKVARLGGQNPRMAEMQAAVAELMVAVDAEPVALAVREFDAAQADEEYYRNTAFDQFEGDIDFEIEADAVVSILDGTGAWVQAWVWIDGPEDDDEEDGS